MLLIVDYQKVEFEEGFSVEMKPLDVVSYQAVTKLLSAIQPSSTMASEEMAIYGFEQMSNELLTQVANKVIPAHCRNLTGIQIKEEGSIRDATIDDIIAQGAFIQIAFSIITRLFSMSTLSAQEEEAVKKQ